MNKYFIDTNVILRVLLHDHEAHAREAERLFAQAQKGEVSIIILPEIVIEIEYGLRKVYHLTRSEIAPLLETLLHTPYVDVRRKEALALAVQAYAKKNIDLVDALIFFSAQEENANIFSFDKDFRKLR